MEPIRERIASIASRIGDLTPFGHQTCRWS